MQSNIIQFILWLVGTCVCGSTEPRNSPNSEILWYKYLSKCYLYHNETFYHVIMATGLFESGP